MFECGRMKKTPGGVTMVAVAVLAVAAVCCVIGPVAGQQKSSSAEVDQVEGCITSRTGEAVFRVSGVPGPLGPQGPTGSRGRAGPKGGTGVKGDLGKKGEKGEVGVRRKGDQGVKGNQGLKGDTGTPGLRGSVGMPGPPGVQGPRGLGGRRGAEGPRGPEGARGTVGDTGLPGAPGVPGSPGAAQLSPQDHQRIVADVSKEVAAQTISNVRSLPSPSSCREVYAKNPEAESGYRYLKTSAHYVSAVREVYCDMGPLCGEEGGWTAVAKLDMADPRQTCPPGLVEHHNPSNSSQRACGRPGDAVHRMPLPAHGIHYSKVCGRIHGYQYGLPDGLGERDGILIGRGTNGHIWAYIAAWSETVAPHSSCPCSGIGYSGGNPIGNNYYYCESGSSGYPSFNTTYWDDPLWDGKDCPSGNSCCERYGWFSRSFGTNSDDLYVEWNLNELRANEDLYLDVIEIYIK